MNSSKHATIPRNASAARRFVYRGRRISFPFPLPVSPIPLSFTKPAPLSQSFLEEVARDYPGGLVGQDYLTGSPTPNRPDSPKAALAGLQLPQLSGASSQSVGPELPLPEPPGNDGRHTPLWLGADTHTPPLSCWRHGGGLSVIPATWGACVGS